MLCNLPNHENPAASSDSRVDRATDGLNEGCEPPSASSDRERPVERAQMARVLVVEDDAPVREHAVRLLRRLGYEVREAADGDTAMRLLARDPRCDVLFTDVVMPGMSGGQLAQAAKLLLPDIGVVFVTGHHSDLAVEQLKREGSATFVAKPYRSQAVVQALALLSQRRRGRDTGH